METKAAKKYLDKQSFEKNFQGVVKFLDKHPLTLEAIFQNQLPGPEVFELKKIILSSKFYGPYKIGNTSLVTQKYNELPFGI